MILLLFAPAGAWPIDDPQSDVDLARLGTVVETFDAGGFTYARVDLETEQVWMAGPPLVLAIGDRVGTSEGALMADFRSRTLDRTFDRIWFVAAWRVMGAAPPRIDPLPVKPAAGTRTVADVLDHASTLAGQTVAVTGRVTRVSPGILGFTWIHLQDGVRDLPATTHATPQVGERVVLRGRVGVDRDLGHGYRFPVLLEDASIEPLPAEIP